MRRMFEISITKGYERMKIEELEALEEAAAIPLKVVCTGADDTCRLQYCRHARPHEEMDICSRPRYSRNDRPATCVPVEEAE